MVLHACNPSPWEAEAGEMRVQAQLGLHSEISVSKLTHTHMSEKSFLPF